jgi:dihydrofolate reductase
LSSRVNVRMIWAQSRGGVIGAEGTLPWHLPEDLALFRELTLDSTVVMGRVTWESLPDRVRPLPRRRNVVLTRRPHWQAPGAEVARSPQDVVDRHPDCWVIGGAAVYEAMIVHACRVVRTEVDEDFAGDTLAPRLSTGWQQVERRPERGWSMSRVGLRYAVGEYTRYPDV